MGLSLGSVELHHRSDICFNEPGLDKEMNNIIWLVGAVVIVLAILSFLGLG